MMKINNYYMLIFMFPLTNGLANVSDPIYEKTCFTGHAHFTVTNATIEHFDADEHLRLIRCHTKGPTCGMKMVLEEHGHSLIKYLALGCFKREELHRRVLIGSTGNVRIVLDNARHQYMFARRQINGFEDYFEKFKPENDPDHEEHFDNVLDWVENPMQNVPKLKKKTTTSFGAGDAEIELNNNKLSPVMLCYVIFIMVSVIVRTIWLVKTAIQQYRKGYEAVPNKPKNFTSTVEDDSQL